MKDRSGPRRLVALGKRKLLLVTAGLSTLALGSCNACIQESICLCALFDERTPLEQTVAFGIPVADLAGNEDFDYFFQCNVPDTQTPESTTFEFTAENLSAIEIQEAQTALDAGDVVAVNFTVPFTRHQNPGDGIPCFRISATLSDSSGILATQTCPDECGDTLVDSVQPACIAIPAGADIASLEASLGLEAFPNCLGQASRDNGNLHFESPVAAEIVR